MTLSFLSSGELLSGISLPYRLLILQVSLQQLDDSSTVTILRFMSLQTGGIHPLAKQADLSLDTQLPVSLLDVRADIIGDQIVLVLVDLRPSNPKNDSIYLVDWKKGLMTLVGVFFYFIPDILQARSK
jgi:hypothetical protein